ncbi:MAG: MFS transporter [Actinobacteria bacterium]|jgi:MFS family permease|nr:MFS transporter [Actinomycetota bacterium]
MTLFAFEGMAVATVMPVVAIEFDGLGLYAWAFSAYVALSLVGMVVAGTWCDRDGPRRAMWVGLWVFAGGAVIAGVAWSMPVLIAARGLQGLGGGALIVATYVLIARAFPEDLRPKAFSLLAAAWVVPAIVGPLIAAWLTEALSWRFAFWLVPFVLVLPALLLRKTLREHDGGTGERGRSGRIIPALVTAGGLTLAMAAFMRPAGLPLWADAAGLMVGVAMLAYGVRILLPPGCFRLRRGLPTTVLMRGILAGAFFGAEAFIPLALVEQRGFTVILAGLVLSVSALGWWVGSYAQGRIPESSDRSPTVRTGALLMASGIASLPLCLVPGVPAVVCAVSYFVASIGMGLCFPSIAVQTLRLSPVDEQGNNSAALQISDAILSSLALGILGAIHAAAVTSGGATTTTYDVLWWLAAAVGIVAAAIASRMKPVSAMPVGRTS